MEVTAEVGASKPITAGDVVGRAGHGPERASVPITAGTRRPGRARPGDEVCRASEIFPETIRQQWTTMDNNTNNTNNTNLP